MPICRGIEVELVSQFGAYPEYNKHAVLATEGVRHNISETYVVMHPGSHFWIRYSCAPIDESPFFHFKLLINGLPVVSWGCAVDEAWHGTTAFVPVDAGVDEHNRRVVEKRGFFFPSVLGGSRDLHDSVLEMRVFRAKARKREHRQYASEAAVCNENASLW